MKEDIASISGYTDMGLEMAVIHMMVIYAYIGQNPEFALISVNKSALVMLP